MPDPAREPLSVVTEIVMGQSPPGASYNEQGAGLPFFQGKAEFGELIPTAVKWCTDPRRVAEPGDILMSVRAPVGPTNLANMQCCIGRGLAAIRAVPTRLDPSYLRYFLRYSEPRLAGMGQGSTFSSIGRAEIAGLKIYLPPLKEQRRIADLLTRAENIARMRREAEQKAKELIPALFLDMFGDPGTNAKALPIVPLGKLLSFRTGKLDSNAAVPGGPYPFFTCSRDDSAIDNYAFDCEALLLAGNNAAGEYSVKYYSGKFNAYQRTYVLNLLDASHSYEFMRQALQLRLQELKRLSLGSATKYLTLGILKNVPIQLPSSAQQKAFADRSISVQQLGERERYATARADLTFQSLLAGVFAE